MTPYSCTDFAGKNWPTLGYNAINYDVISLFIYCIENYGPSRSICLQTKTTHLLEL